MNDYENDADLRGSGRTTALAFKLIAEAMSTAKAGGRKGFALGVDHYPGRAGQESLLDACRSIRDTLGFDNISVNPHRTDFGTYAVKVEVIRMSWAQRCAAVGLPAAHLDPINCRCVMVPIKLPKKGAVKRITAAAKKLRKKRKKS